jgi:hypothetical protein
MKTEEERLEKSLSLIRASTEGKPGFGVKS